MPIETYLSDGEGTNGRAAVVKKNGDLPGGVVAYTDDLRSGGNTGILYSNSTFGFELNQNAGFTGTPVGIHNGIDSVLWTGAAITGTWTFDSTTQAHSGSKSIDASAATNNKEMSISDGSGITVGSYTAISCWIYITAWGGNSEVSIRTQSSSVAQGETVLLSNYITPGIVGAWQQFAIPTRDFGLLSTDNIDELIFRQVSSAPNYFLDDMQWEETGGTIEYAIEARPGTLFHAVSITIFIVASEDSRLADASMPNNTYSEFCGISALPVGLLLLAEKAGVLSLAGIARDLGDLLLPSTSFSTAGDGSTTCYHITTVFSGTNILDSRKTDRRIIRVNDNLSTLLRFRVLVNGWQEDISEMHTRTVMER